MSQNEPLNIIFNRPSLYPKQLEIFECEERYTCCEASTKSGKTHMCIIWILEQALLGKQGYNYWWVAPVFSQSAIAFNRLKLALRVSGLPDTAYKIREGNHTIEMGNGAIISFKSGDNPNSLYGEDVYGCVVDEASRVLEESWFAIRTTLTATKGQIKLIGNVVNKVNWFYKLCRSNVQNLKYFRLTAQDAVDGGVIDASEVEDAKRVLPKHIFEALYLCIVPEDGLNPFGISYIEACTIQVPDVGIKTFSYLSPQKIVCYGIDLARGKNETSDFTSIIGLTADCEVGMFEFIKGPWNSQVNKLKNIIGNTPALIELNSIGSPVSEFLSEDCPNLEGFNTTSKSKKELIEKDLTPVILNKSIRIPYGVITNELMNYEYQEKGINYTYNASTGHDDAVIALALCCKKLKEIMGEPNTGNYDVCVFDVKHPTFSNVNYNKNNDWKKVNTPLTGF